MKKEEVITLAREIFKIRLKSSNEGSAEDDGVHQMTIRGIAFYDHKVIEKWYKDAIKTAEIIIALEEEYLNNV